MHNNYELIFMVGRANSSVNNFKSLSIGLYVAIFIGIVIMAIMPILSGGNYDNRSKAVGAYPNRHTCSITHQCIQSDTGEYNSLLACQNECGLAPGPSSTPTCNVGAERCCTPTDMGNYGRQYCYPGGWGACLSCGPESMGCNNGICLHVSVTPTPTPIICIDSDYVDKDLRAERARAGTCTENGIRKARDYCVKDLTTKTAVQVEAYCDWNDRCHYLPFYSCDNCDEEGRCPLVSSPTPTRRYFPSPTPECVSKTKRCCTATGIISRILKGTQSGSQTCSNGFWLPCSACTGLNRCYSGVCTSFNSTPTPTPGSGYTIKPNIGSGLNCDKICRKSYLFCKSIGTDAYATDGNIMSWTDTAFCFRGSGNNCFSVVNNKTAPKTCIYGSFNRQPEWTNCRCYSPTN